MSMASRDGPSPEARPWKHIPYLIAVNLTERCNLNCAHCYMDAGQRHAGRGDELSHQELVQLFADISRRAPGTIIVLTGGEPLMHPEVEQIIDSGSGVGLRMVLGTNGVLLGAAKISKLKDLGLSGVGVSLDSVYAEQHDSFRGVPGSFERAREAIALCRSRDLHAQVHFTVTRNNHHQLEKIVDLSLEAGAVVVNFFFLVCIGRGKSHIDLSPDQYESSLRTIARLQKSATGIMIQSRCTPHFKRILYEDDPHSPYTRATGYEGGGCPAATHYCRISPAGEVTPCPYIELSAGNIRERDFWEIWEDAVLLRALRDSSLLQGRCSQCEYRLLCGGCRARSLAQSGDLMGEDPNCTYVPRGEELIAIQETVADEEVEWTPEARERLKGIPVFLRPLIERRLEERARGEGMLVTAALMQRHREERERELGIRFN